MKYHITLAAIAIASFTAVSANAGEYVCKVYCTKGTTQATVKADSKSDAAKKIDSNGVADQVCKDAGKGAASSSTMKSEQCSAA